MMRIKRLLARIRAKIFIPKDWLPPAFEGKKIQFAFADEEGVRYYCFANDAEMACVRAMYAMEFYNELEMKVDRAYLVEFVSIMKQFLSADVKTGKISLQNALWQISDLEARLAYLCHPDLPYKLASVKYFTKEEDPFDYDMAVGLKKIERWKKQKTLRDFFFSSAIPDLLPRLEALGTNLETYLKGLEAKELRYLERVLSGVKSGSLPYNLPNNLLSRVEALVNSRRSEG